MIKKITDNARVLYENKDNMSLVSYSTTVITVVDGVLTCKGLYSATTRKHISRFMRDFTNGDYFTAKKCYTDNVRYNINTREFIEK